MLDLELAAQLDLELDLQVDCEFSLEQDPTRMLLVALTNFGASSFLATAIGGGEAGDTTSFGGVLLFRVPRKGAAVAANRVLIENYATGGWYVILDAANGVLSFGSTNGAGGNFGQTLYTLTASDYGRVMCLVYAVSGASNLARFVINRTSIADVPVTGYMLPTARAMSVGNRAPSADRPAPDYDYLSSLNFRGLPTTQQMLDYSVQARARGDLPEAFPGVTVTHRHSVRDELLYAANPVGRKTYGITRGTATNYFGVSTALAGSGAGFSGSIVATLYPGQFLIGRTNNSNAGWVLYVSSGGTLQLSVHNGTTFVPTATYAVTSADYGRPQLISFVHTGSVLRLYVGRQQIGADAAIGAFNAYVGPTTLLATPVGGFTSNQTAVFALDWADSAFTAGDVAALADAFDATGGVLGTVAGKSTHHYDINTALVANSLAVPATIADTIGTDNLTRTGTVEVFYATATGPAAPAQLTDTATRASSDALIKFGNPGVKIIDPSIDGRRTFGLQGFSLTNSLVSAVNAGVQGSASGFHFVWRGQFSQLPSGSQALAGCLNTAGTQGWHMHITTVIRMYAGNYSASYTPTAADVRRPITLHGVHTGTAVRLYVDGVQIGADVAVAFTAAAGFPFLVGQALGGNVASESAMYECGGGNYVPTLAEIQQQVADSNAAGTLQPISATKTPHLYRITDDVIGSGVEAVPSVVLDRVGADHLTRTGIDVRSTANGIRGVGPYGVTDGWTTAPGGGIQGASGGFFVTVDVWLTQVPTGVETIAWCAVTGTSGWFLQTVSGSTIRWVMPSGQLSSSYTITAADLNKRTRFTVHRTGLNMQLFANGVQVGADTGGTFTANAANAVSFQLGTANGASNFSSGYIESCSGGLSPLTAGELTTLHADLTQAAPVIAGKTTKRWVFEQDIAVASGVLPARSVERVSGSDNLARFGSPLTLAQRTERLWSYETSPIFYGANAFTDADNFASVAGTGPAGDAAGWWAAMPFVLETQSVSAGVHVVMGRSFNYGWDIRTIGTNSSIFWTCSNGAGTFPNGPSFAFTASEIGKQQLMFIVYDPAAGKMRTYIKRAEIGAGTTIVGFTPADAPSPFRLGRHASLTSFPASGVRVLGAMYGRGIPSAAEIYAAHDAYFALEELVDIPGKTDFRVSLTLDARAVGGVLPSALLDRIGAVHMTRQGAPGIVPMYARVAA